MTEQELKQIEDRASAATPGPWVHDTVQSESAVICGHAPGVVCEWIKGAAAFDDCAFIARAREDIPKLIAEVRRLQEVLSNYDPELMVGKITRALEQGLSACSAFTPEGEVK